MIVFLALRADAHRTGISTLTLSDREVALTLAEVDVAAKFPIADDLGPSTSLIVGATLDKLAITADGQPCILGEASVQRVAADGIEIRASLSCSPGTWTVDAAYLADLETGHREMVEADGVTVAVLDAANPSATFDGTTTTLDVAGRFVGLGVEHIWTGYDHIAFLAALVLVAKDARQMLTVATGFTVAHSITLALAATGVVQISPSIVEPAIAASIVFVGVENLWKPPIERRIAITFLLGLIHGFGFAGQLAELGLPRGSLVVALLSFNGGVEIGQAVIVLLTLPLLVKLRERPEWDDKAVPALSLLIAAMGLFWLVERIGSLAPS